MKLKSATLTLAIVLAILFGIEVATQRIGDEIALLKMGYLVFKVRRLLC